jgi:hypothetical protein
MLRLAGIAGVAGKAYCDIYYNKKAISIEAAAGISRARGVWARRPHFKANTDNQKGSNANHTPQGF